MSRNEIDAEIIAALRANQEADHVLYIDCEGTLSDGLSDADSRAD
jgi:hypothetical protein